MAPRRESGSLKEQNVGIAGAAGFEDLELLVYFCSCDLKVFQKGHSLWVFSFYGRCYSRHLPPCLRVDCISGDFERLKTFFLVFLSGERP